MESALRTRARVPSERVGNTGTESQHKVPQALPAGDIHGARTQETRWPRLGAERLRVSSGESGGDRVNGGRAAYGLADAGPGRDCNLDDEGKQGPAVTRGLPETRGVGLCGGHEIPCTTPVRASRRARHHQLMPGGALRDAGKCCAPRGLRSQGLTNGISCVPAGASSARRGCTYLYIPQRVLGQWRHGSPGLRALRSGSVCTRIGRRKSGGETGAIPIRNDERLSIHGVVTQRYRMEMLAGPGRRQLDEVVCMHARTMYQITNGRQSLRKGRRAGLVQGVRKR